MQQCGWYSWSKFCQHKINNSLWFGVLGETNNVFWLADVLNCTILVIFCVVYCSNFLITRQKNVVTWKELIDISSLSVKPCDRYSSQFDLSNKSLVDSWCSCSKIVNHISDRSFNCLSGSVIPTDKSKCIAKFRFAAVFISTNNFSWLK